MTTTAPAIRHPDWTARDRRSSSAEAVRDPDWVASKLRAALSREYPAAHAAIILGEIVLWTTGAEEFVAAITDRPSLPPVRWSRYYGHVEPPPNSRGRARLMPSLSTLVSDWETDDRAGVAQQWATALRLREVPDPGPGIRRWDGVHEGWYVEVWIITDRDAFEAG